MPTKIVVLGAAVIDHVYTVISLPDWGEGVHADSFTSLPGGKGLNQVQTSIVKCRGSPGGCPQLALIITAASSSMP